jgi:hypothetical protein
MNRGTIALALGVLLAACGRSSTAPGHPDDQLTPADVEPAAPGEEAGPPEEPGGEPGVPGSPPPLATLRMPDGRCYAYDRWLVVVRPRQTAAGEDITVFARAPGGDPLAGCRTTDAEPVARFNDPASPDAFFGLAEDLLLIDSGTSSRGRTIRAMDLATGRTELEAIYEEPVAISDGTLEFSEPVGAFERIEEVTASGVNCPDAEAWLEDGFAIGVNRRVRFALGERRREESGDLVCVPLQ